MIPRVERRNTIQQILRDQQRVPSVREMTGLLRKQGLRFDKSTIWQDYEALGLNEVVRQHREDQRLLRWAKRLGVGISGAMPGEAR